MGGKAAIKFHSMARDPPKAFSLDSVYDFSKGKQTS